MKKEASDSILSQLSVINMAESMQNSHQLEPGVSERRKDQGGPHEYEIHTKREFASSMASNSYLKVPEEKANIPCANESLYATSRDNTNLRENNETVITIDSDCIKSGSVSTEDCADYKQKFLDVIMCCRPTKLPSLVINFIRHSNKRMLFLILLLWIIIECSQMNKRVELSISTTYNQALTVCLYNCDENIQNNMRTYIIKAILRISLKMFIYVISPFCSNFGVSITINSYLNSMYV